MNFDDLEEAAHIQKVDHESRQIFSHLRHDKTKMEAAFQCPFELLNLELAWAEFDRIAYDTMFKETGGDLEALYDPMTRGRILTRVFHRWPLSYYVKLLTSAGIMDVIDSQGSELYFFKEAYKESINTLVTASSIKSGS